MLLIHLTVVIVKHVKPLEFSVCNSAAMTYHVYINTRVHYRINRRRLFVYLGYVFVLNQNSPSLIQAFQAVLNSLKRTCANPLSTTF